MLRKGGDALHYTSAHFISITIKANYVLPIFIDGEMETQKLEFLTLSLFSSCELSPYYAPGPIHQTESCIVPDP